MLLLQISTANTEPSLAGLSDNYEVLLCRGTLWESLCKNALGVQTEKGIADIEYLMLAKIVGKCFIIIFFLKIKVSIKSTGSHFQLDIFNITNFQS